MIEVSPGVTLRLLKAAIGRVITADDATGDAGAADQTPRTRTRTPLATPASSPTPPAADTPRQRRERHVATPSAARPGRTIAVLAVLTALVFGLIWAPVRHGGGTVSTGVSIVGAGLSRFGRQPGRTGRELGAARRPGRAARRRHRVGRRRSSRSAAATAPASPTPWSRDLGLTGIPFINVKNGCATGGSALMSAVERDPVRRGRDRPRRRVRQAPARRVRPAARGLGPRRRRTARPA